MKQASLKTGLGCSMRSRPLATGAGISVVGASTVCVTRWCNAGHNMSVLLDKLAYITKPALQCIGAHAHIHS
eukprot:3316731-Amphidinium_carterae.1